MVLKSIINTVRSRSTTTDDGISTHSRTAPALRNISLTPALAYLLLTAGWLLLTLVDWSPLRLHETFKAFVHWWLLLSLPLVISTLMLRAWKLSALMMVPGLLFWAWYGALFLPQPTVTCDADCSSFTVMTTNTSPVAAAEDVVAGIRASEADIVVIQELMVWQAEAIEAELSQLYPHQAMYPSASLAGIGIISKYPVSNAESFGLAFPNFPYIMADVEIDGRIVTVIGAHPYPPGSIPYVSRLEPDIEALQALIAEKGDVVLAGDFNTTDRHSDYHRLRSEGLNDAWRAAGSGFGSSFPNAGRFVGLPVPALIRIDHVFYTDAFSTMKAEHGPDTGGDHKTILATIAWPE